MVKVEVSGTRGTVFEFGDFEVTISAVRHNRYMGAFIFDMYWRVKGVLNTIEGIAIASGVDLMAQYPDAPLPNLWALSSFNLAGDTTSLADLTFYIE